MPLAKCGSELARESGVSVIPVLADTPSLRASPLLHFEHRSPGKALGEMGRDLFTPQVDYLEVLDT